MLPRNDSGHRRFTWRCNILQDHPDFVHAPFRVPSMTSARLVRCLRSAIPDRRRAAKAPSYVLASAVAIGALAAMALVNRHLANKAERDNPAAGRFLDVDGVRLHYVERGSGEPLVLLHGNGSMIEDFESSGLIDLAARDHRVIVFDRPGFGHSDRPRNVVCTQDALAELIKHALKRLGVSNAIVFRHSWGASVAVALAPEISRSDPWLGSCLRVLLSHGETRHRRNGRTGLAVDRRHPQPYPCRR